MRGTLVDGRGAALVDKVVKLVADGGSDSMVTTTDDRGSYCVDGPQGSEAAVFSLASSDGSPVDWSAAVQTPVQSASCAIDVGSCRDLGESTVLTPETLFSDCQVPVSSDQDHVLLLSSGAADVDASLQGVLTEFGHQVTLGPKPEEFDGALDLFPYDALVLQPSFVWMADMPVSGQQQIAQWVHCGGGMLTAEWTTWMMMAGHYHFLSLLHPAQTERDPSSYGSARRRTSRCAVACQRAVCRLSDVSWCARCGAYFALRATAYWASSHLLRAPARTLAVLLSLINVRVVSRGECAASLELWSAARPRAAIRWSVHALMFVKAAAVWAAARRSRSVALGHNISDATVTAFGIRRMVARRAVAEATASRRCGWGRRGASVALKVGQAIVSGRGWRSLAAMGSSLRPGLARGWSTTSRWRRGAGLQPMR